MNPLKRKHKKELDMCVKCDHIRPAVKYKVGNRRRINEASCVRRGVFIKDKGSVCIWCTSN